MDKITFAIKLNRGILNRLKHFCMAHGTKYSFFVEKAIEEKLAEEELKELEKDIAARRQHGEQ